MGNSLYEIKENIKNNLKNEGAGAPDSWGRGMGNGTHNPTNERKVKRFEKKRGVVGVQTPRSGIGA